MGAKVKSDWHHNGQVLHLTLSDPPGNVLDSVMMGALQAALDEAADRPGLKLIQFQGAGDHFCFGASVPEHTREKAPAMLAQFHRLFYTLADLAVPTAVMLSGQCLGGGLELDQFKSRPTGGFIQGGLQSLDHRAA